MVAADLAKWLGAQGVRATERDITAARRNGHLGYTKVRRFLLSTPEQARDWVEAGAQVGDYEPQREGGPRQLKVDRAGKLALISASLPDDREQLVEVVDSLRTRIRRLERELDNARQRIGELDLKLLRREADLDAAEAGRGLAETRLRRLIREIEEER